ncbi:MAG TPA: hypothetical protein VGN17_13650 [Bryobacteraceae bacterium]|jgi:hypothetical protein
MSYLNVHPRNPLAGLICAVLIGSSFAAAQQSPTVTVTPTQVNLLNVPSGGSATQTVNVSVSSSSAIVVDTSTLPSWLQITPNGSVNVTAGTPTTLTLTAMPPASLAPGSYDSSFSVGTQGSTTPQTIVVTTFVSGKSVLSAGPSSLSFTALPGSNQASPTVASVKISSSGSLLEYSATATTVNGQNWLIPLTVNGATGNSSVPATPLLVSVNPSGLNPGTYLGQILVQSTTTQDSVTIAVSLMVGPNTSLSITPSSLQPFFFQSNSASTPAAQQLTVTSSASAANFTVALNPPVPWLTASVAPGASTPGGGSSSTITLMAAPLQNVGLFTTSLLINNGTSQISIPVSYAVGVGPVPQLTPSQLTFTSSASQIPASQNVQVALPNAGNPVGFTVTTDSSWLRATASTQLTPATITVTAIPTGLAAGTYTGHVTVQPTNGDLYAVPVTVMLTVTGSPTLLTSGPPVLLFSNQIGQAAPGAQILQLNSNGQVLSYTTATSSTTAPNCSANWLKVSALSANPSTPSALAVTIDPTGLMAGICSGTVTLNYGTAGTTGTIGSIQVPVIVETSASPLVNVNVPPGFGFETTTTCSTTNNGTSSTGTASTGSSNSCPVIVRQITLSSTDGITPLNFTASAANSGTTPWLFVSPNSGQTPTVLTVLIDPANLPPGNYNGSITIGSMSANSAGLPLPIAIPITLTVGSTVAVTATPATLNFTQTAGGSVPASQTVTLTSSASGATYTAFVPNSATCGWVKVSPMSGPATGPITVSVLSNSLTANSYSCPITLMLNGASTQTITLMANLAVSAGQGGGQSLTVAPQSLTFASTATTPQPASQQLSLTASGGSGTFSITSTSSGWLSVSPTQGTAPATITVSVNPQSVGTGSSPFTGSITITPSGGGTPVSVPVTLTVASSTGSNVTVSAAPSTLNFTQTAGGTVPAAQTFTLTSSATGATFTASIPTTTNCGWVQVSPMSGPATGAITVTVLSNSLTANSYTCPVTLNLTGATTQSIPITANLTVNAGQSQGQNMLVSPQSLTFSYSTAVPQPAAQQLVISTSGTGASTAANFTVAATSTGGWLSVTPVQGTTPATISVSVSLQNVGFGSGTLSGSITVTPTGGGNAITVPVTLNHQ